MGSLQRHVQGDSGPCHPGLRLAAYQHRLVDLSNGERGYTGWGRSGRPYVSTVDGQSTLEGDPTVTCPGYRSLTRRSRRRQFIVNDPEVDEVEPEGTPCPFLQGDQAGTRERAALPVRPRCLVDLDCSL